MASIVTSSQAVELTHEQDEKVKKHLQDMVAKCDSQTEMDTFTWKYCKQTLFSDLSIKVSAPNDKKRLKEFATKVILEKIELLKKKEEQAAKAVQELFASDEDEEEDSDDEDNIFGEDKEAADSNLSKTTAKKQKKKKGNNVIAGLNDDDSSSGSGSSSSSSSDDSISSDSSDSSDSEESASEDDSDEDGPYTIRQAKRFSDKTTPPKIAPEVAQLLDAYCSKAALRDTMNRIHFSNGRLGKGKITRTQIQAAYTLLRQLQDVVNGPDYERDEQIKELSRNFFEKIKFEDENSNNNNNNTDKSLAATATITVNETLINSLELIQTYAERLQIISMVEASNRIISGTKKKHENAMDTNYIDTKYRVLPCQISFVNSESGQWKKIERAVKTTQASIHNDKKLVLNKLYSIERSSELSRFEPFKALPNRKLLWYPVHSKGALAGILSLGLRVIPPDAPTTGLMFGKGIRLYDSVSRAVRDTEHYVYPITEKSIGNADATNDKIDGDDDDNNNSNNSDAIMVVDGEETDGKQPEEEQSNGKEAVNNEKGHEKVFLILCDVACGKQNEMRRSLYMQNAPPPYHSVKAIGQFNTTSNIPWTSTDMFAPELSIGPMHDTREQNSTKLKFNEYVIYDKGQVCMKYLVELDLKNPSEVVEEMIVESEAVVEKTTPTTTMMMDVDNNENIETTTAATMQTPVVETNGNGNIANTTTTESSSATLSANISP